MDKAQKLDGTIHPTNFNLDETELSQKLIDDDQQRESIIQRSISERVQEAKRKRCCNSLFEKPPPTKRIIRFDGYVTPPIETKNVIKNQKYNPYFLIFQVFYNQFKFFSNMFFLLTAVSQFFTPLQTGYLITYIGPLALVLILTMLKEAYDDYERYKRDKEANGAIYRRMQGDKFVSVPSADLKVGDIIEVLANQRIPADLVLLYTPEVGGSVFIKTDQLDGETDWKLRKPIAFTQNFFKNGKPMKELSSAKITANPPIENIYQFEGLFQVGLTKEALSLENTLWASTALASTKIIALVVYTGKDMRIVMNSREPRTKVGQFEHEINFLSKLLFVVLLGFSFMLVGINGFAKGWIIQFLRFLILLCSIIPISLRVNLDFAKMVYSYQINNDKGIPGTIARNRMIPEEIGRVQYLLSDKTGTLTQNEMIFKKISLENEDPFTPERVEEIKKIVKKNSEKTLGPLADVADRHNSVDGTHMPGSTGRARIRRDREYVIRDMITALILCHNVTPVTDDKGERSFQASSPDEIALVKIAEELGFCLESRDQSTMTIKNPAGNHESYEILANFPFSSESKRMGILLRHIESSRIIFYLKGADTIMKEKVPKNQKDFLIDECENLARDGLRTLVISQKFLSAHEYDEWKAKFDSANQSLNNRAENVKNVINILENEMEFLGITGVEDKLQEDVRETIETLKHAGIQTWMLTGDKIETATCIAISTGLKSTNQRLFVMKELTDILEIKKRLDEFFYLEDEVLIIDGITLAIALDKCYRDFFISACKAPAVVCCRCSPTQKALVTEGIKKIAQKKTCSIGDGGNDVGMIQAADVGIGIEGKEGKQAALAADYSITKFKYLARLLLWHGRLSYKRSAVLSQFVIHRGLTISIIQIVFSCVFYSLSMAIYGGVLMLGYSTIFTMFPVFCLIFDEDIDIERALEYSPLYKTLQKGRELNMKTFFIWMWKSIYQGAAIMLLALFLFKDTAFYNIVTITFTALIVSEMLNIMTELHKIRWMTILSILGSLGAYFLTIILLKASINASKIDSVFIAKVAILTAISWGPLHLMKIIMHRMDPSEEEKIMKSKRRRVNELEALEQTSN